MKRRHSHSERHERTWRAKERWKAEGHRWKHEHWRHGKTGRPPLGWLLARGIHRRIFGVLVIAAVLGGIAGWGLHAQKVEHASGLLCLAIAAMVAIWPLGWFATFRIAWPLRELAQVAHQIDSGQLDLRKSLPEGPGEVGEVSVALRGVADRVAKQLDDQRALMAAVSHELRSPLARVRVLVEMQREGSAPVSVHDDLQAEIDAMDELVGDLLAAARIDFEAVSPQVQRASEVAVRALEVAELSPEVLTVVEDADVRADPTLLARALASLLDNARRHGGGGIELVVRPRVHHVRFEVNDDGPGFSDGEEEQVFQPFYRGPARRARGEGLGLALVRQIAETHGGEAGARNREEGGACVWIELPRAVGE